jgi:hypothetical protein
MKDEKKSIVKEALVDYNTIQQAADANAKKRLAEEFPKEFNNILKEELNKNKSAKESKKLDESETNKESVMKNQVKETKKVEETAGKGLPFEKPAPKAQNVKETVTIQDTVGDTDPFVEKEKNGGIIVNKAESKGEVEETVTIQDTIGDTDPFDQKKKEGGIIVNKAKAVEEAVKVTDTVGKSDPYKDKAKKVQKVEETFDITELDASSVGSAIENAAPNDEVLTMEEIEREISEMEGLGEELKGINQDSPSYMQKGNGGIAFDQLVNMKNQLDEIIQSMGTQPSVEEMHSAGATDGAQTYGTDSQISQQHAQGPTDKLIDEESPITDDDINAVLGGGQEPPVEESQTRTLSNQKKVTAALPGKEYKPDAVSKMRFAMQESEKKISSLIEENKKLTKKLNETKKYKETVTGLVESYKSALGKYRNQLKEMAIFNTNLAHVNNLLVNEGLALTQEDKIKIINEFKKVDSIAASQKAYKTFLTEMKGSKKTLTESVEDKVSASIQPSSKGKLDEVVEKTAYADDKHIQRMRKLIETIENRGKKIIK